MKRVLALILSVIMVAVVFSACEREKGESSISSKPESSASSEDEVLPSNQLNRYSDTFMEYFDTVTILIGYTETQEEFSGWSDKFREELDKCHKLFDIYNDYEGINNVKTINDNAGKQPVEVSEELLDFLEFGIDMYNETDGLTNMAMGSVLKIWHNYREEALDNAENARVPSMQDLEKAAKHMNIDDVIIDREAGTVFLVNPKMSLDVGSLGKGYAVERACDIMQQQGLDHFLLNAGGNVKAIGKKNDIELWNTGLENPYGENELMGVIGLDGSALVTSGNYQRFYEVDGFRYHHIIDPLTLMPKNDIASVTILCDDSGLADAFSTALFNMSVEDGEAWVAKHPEVEAMWMLPDRSTIATSGFEEKMIELN